LLKVHATKGETPRRPARSDHTRIGTAYTALLGAVCRHVPLLVRILQGRLGGHEVGGGVEFSRTTLETFILVQWGPTDNALPDDKAGILPTLRTHVGVSQLIMALRIHRRLRPATDGSDRFTASEVVAVCLYER
jgi:hypothetical protein